MEVPPEITFRGLEKRAEIETHILEKTAKLDEIHPGIISCREAVENEQGKVKTGIDRELTGYVVRLFRLAGYGFIRSVDSREIYLHQNAVLHDDFQRLEIGTGVRYFPSQGDQGPKASTVQIKEPG
jgi:cold shock CspA family protein